MQHLGVLATTGFFAARCFCRCQPTLWQFITDRWENIAECCSVLWLWRDKYWNVV